MCAEFLRYCKNFLLFDKHISKPLLRTFKVETSGGYRCGYEFQTILDTFMSLNTPKLNMKNSSIIFRSSYFDMISEKILAVDQIQVCVNPLKVKRLTV